MHHRLILAFAMGVIGTSFPIGLSAGILNPGSPVLIDSSTIVDTLVSVAGNSTEYMAAWGENNGDLYLSSSTNQGQSWVSVENISAVIPNTTCLATNGTTFVVGWVDASNNYPYAASSSNAWTPFPLSNNTTTPSIDIISNSTGYMGVWTESTGGYITTYKGHYSFASDGVGWSSAGLISSSDNIDYTAISIGANSSGFLAVWKKASGQCGQAFYPNGGPWPSATVISNTVTLAGGVKPAVCGSGSGEFVVAYVDSSYNAYSVYTTNNGSTWSVPSFIASNISDSTTGLNISQLADGFVVSWQNNSNNALASYSSNNGVSWAAPISITLDSSLESNSGVGVSGVGSNCMFTWWSNADAYSSYSAPSSSSTAAGEPQGIYKLIFGTRPGRKML